MPAHPDEQLAFRREHLHPVLHRIGYPDVTVGVDRNALGSREISRTVSRLAKGPDESPIRIENLDAVVEGVGDVEIAVLIDRDIGRPRKIARRGRFMLGTRFADGAQKIEGRIGIVDQHLVEFAVGDVEEAGFRCPPPAPLELPCPG